MDCSWTNSTHFPLNCSWGHSKCLGRTWTPPGTESRDNSALPTAPSPTVEPTNADHSCQINLFKHTSDFWQSISWQMGSKWKALKSKDAMEEKFLRCRGDALQSFFSKSLIGSVWLRPQIMVSRLIAPEILSPPRRWQTPARGQRAEEEEQGQILNPSTTLFRDVLAGHAAQRSGSLAVASRGNLVHSLALQNVDGYPHYSWKMPDVLLGTSDNCWLESPSLISFLSHLEVSPDGTLGFSLVQIKAVNPCLTFHR